MSKQVNDGGPAFPTAPENHGYRAGEPAYGTGSDSGMSLRDYFAAAALPGCMDFFNRHPDAAGACAKSKGLTDQETIVLMAWELADAMLAVRATR